MEHLIKNLIIVRFELGTLVAKSLLEKAGPFAGTYFQNELYGSTSTQCIPDFTVGGANCPEGAQNMNDCDIDDYARHGNSRDLYRPFFEPRKNFNIRWELSEEIQLNIHLLQ